MTRWPSTFLLFLVATSQQVRAQTTDTSGKAIPGQFIVYYKDDAEESATNKRLFFSPESTVASSESFHVVRELRKGIAVAGINDEQVQTLKKDKSVKKIIPVSAVRDQTKSGSITHSLHSCVAFFLLLSVSLTHTYCFIPTHDFI